MNMYEKFILYRTLIVGNVIGLDASKINLVDSYKHIGKANFGIDLIYSDKSVYVYCVSDKLYVDVLNGDIYSFKNGSLVNDNGSFIKPMGNIGDSGRVKIKSLKI